MIPTYQPRFSDDDVLNIASSNQQTDVMPQLRTLRADFFTTYDDSTVTTTANSIAVPERAVGRAVRDLWLSTDSTLALENFRKLKQMDISELTQTYNASGNTYGYYFEHDTIKFWPPLAETSYCRAFYMYRPNDLVAESRTATITIVGGTTLTVDSVPANITVGSKIDVVKVTPGYQTILKNLTVASKTATTIVVAGYNFAATSVAVGDIVSTARETSVVQLPEDAHDYLQWVTSYDIAIALGIQDMIENCLRRVNQSRQAMKDAMSPRSDEGKKIIDPNSIFRGSSRHRAWATLMR